jgi:hypothetical protein
MASSFKTASARIVSHVPSSVRSWAGFHGPYLPGGRSRQGAPVPQLERNRVDHLPVVPPLTAHPAADSSGSIRAQGLIRHLASTNHQQG